MQKQTPNFPKLMHCLPPSFPFPLLFLFLFLLRLFPTTLLPLRKERERGGETLSFVAVVEQPISRPIHQPARQNSKRAMKLAIWRAGGNRQTQTLISS